ncbi:hypothetical protein TIFTF001_029192 [Ficus carica]|uniref:Putative plant transposon protein domain-containing protein n=1 Tax=Ficus carica TaxID=3494 RepID=A0AA88DR47_FICCA|nr:hypothetical protein TIFTF001_029192 [Ficus carica]
MIGFSAAEWNQNFFGGNFLKGARKISSNFRNLQRSFQENGLSRYAKAWHKLICASLMPTSHQQEVSTERAALLYCICKEMSIDVGRVIRNSLLHSIQAKTTGAHTHPSFIIGLCRSAGVVIDGIEPTEEPDATVNHTFGLFILDTIWSNNGDSNNKKNLQQVVYEQCQSIAEIQRELYHRGQVLTDVQVRIVDLQQSDLDRSQFEHHFFNALGLMMRENGLHSGVNMRGIPSFPDYPAHLLRPNNLKRSVLKRALVI